LRWWQTEIINWDAVAPPELPRHAPVVDVLQPAVPHLLEPLGDEPQLLSSRRLDSLRCHSLPWQQVIGGGGKETDIHLDEPLLRQHRLDHLTAPLAPGDPLWMLLCLQAKPAVLRKKQRSELEEGRRSSRPSYRSTAAFCTQSDPSQHTSRTSVGGEGTLESQQAPTSSFIVPSLFKIINAGSSCLTPRLWSLTSWAGVIFRAPVPNSMST
jgi:hypothetical protein